MQFPLVNDTFLYTTNIKPTLAFMKETPKKLLVRSHFSILVLKCLGFIESNRLMIMTPRPIEKLGCGRGIML